MTKETSSNCYLQWNVGLSFHWSKCALKQWKQCTPPPGFWIIASTGRVIASIFEDKNSINHVDFLSCGVNMNTVNTTSSSRCTQCCKKKRLLVCMLQDLGWESSYSPDLAPSNFHLGPWSCSWKVVILTVTMRWSSQSYLGFDVKTNFSILWVSKH